MNIPSEPSKTVEEAIEKINRRAEQSKLITLAKKQSNYIEKIEKPPEVVEVLVPPDDVRIKKALDRLAGTIAARKEREAAKKLALLEATKIEQTEATEPTKPTELLE